MRTLGLLLTLVLVGTCHGAEQKSALTPQGKAPTYDRLTLDEWKMLAKQPDLLNRWANWRRMTPAAVPALTTLLKQTDRQVLEYAISALEFMGPKAESAIPNLIELLKDKDAAMRQTIAPVLGAIDPEAKTVLPALTELLSDNDWYVRWTAAWTLRKMGPKAKATIPAITRLLQDKNARVRQAAALALENITSHAKAKEATHQSDDLVGDEADYQARQAKLTEDRWEPLLQKAGEPDMGVVLEARLIPVLPGTGTEIQLIYSWRNVSDRPFLPDRFGVSPFLGILVPNLLIRNGKGEPVDLTRYGMHQIYGPMVGCGRYPDLQPGCAGGGIMTVSDYFDLSKPDDYTILAWDGEGSEDFAMSAREESFQRNTGRSRWVAKPVVVKIGKPPTSDDVEHRPDSAHPGKSAGTSQCNDPTDKEWAELMRDAGRPHDQCFLDAIRSPLAPNAVHLVVSLFCLDLSHRSAGRETHMGVNPANYHILIRDNAGEFPPLTDFGREVFASRGREHLSFLWTGHANGAVFPLDELFSLKAGHDYTVLVSLPPEKLSDPGWVAPPVKIQVPELLATGVPRPRYGSEMMWAKLAVMTVTERTDPTLASTIEFGFSPYVAYLKMQLKGKAPTASHGDWRLADKTILVRDSRGKAVFPYKNGMTQKFVGWWTEAPAEIRIRQKSQSRQTATGLPEAREVWYPLSDVFPLRSGCRYTILSASNLTDDVQSVIVSKPMTFSMPVPFDRDGDSRTIGGSTSPNPLATTGTAEASFDSQWNEALRFAGKSFDGLSLEATSGRSIDLKVVLRNCSEKPVLVTKWKGESDFDLMVRRSNGNPVMMTDKGKKFFQSSCLLDVRKLNGHDTIDACLPITDLFDMRVSGDYTVLVTLPVVGDVDAVLTAKPLKVRVP